MSETTHRILGIDPGLNITGYGLIEIENDRPQIIEAGVVRSKRTQSLGKRLASIYNGVDDVIKSLKPDCMGLEELGKGSSPGLRTFIFVKSGGPNVRRRDGQRGN